MSSSLVDKQTFMKSKGAIVQISKPTIHTIILGSSNVVNCLNLNSMNFLLIEIMIGKVVSEELSRMNI